MREIKFRVWNKVSSSWFKDENVLSFYISNDGNIELHEPMYNPETYIFQQYTGLKDKNYVEIYEGDLIISDHWKSDEHMVISWDDDSCKFYASLPNGGDCIDLDEANKLVVGNVFEGINK